MRIGMQMVRALAVAGLALGMTLAVQAADPLTVKTDQGKVKGKTINDGKVKAFLGLPYAASPAGDMRWKAPAAPSKWTGERDAAERGLPVAERLCAGGCDEEEQAAGDVLDSRRGVLGRIGE